MLSRTGIGALLMVEAKGLPCPRCGAMHQAEVKDSRPTAGGVKRVRACLKCRKQFPTIEISRADFERLVAAPTGSESPRI